jgi:hypothetical protein
MEDKYIVYISHFVRMGTNPLDYNTLKLAMLRGCGLQLKFNNKGSDLVIPVFSYDNPGELSGDHTLFK